MGMGLQAAYGADALQQNLRQRILDQIAEQQRQFQNNRLTQNDARAAQEHAFTMQSLKDQREATQQNALEGQAQKLAGSLEPDQSIPAPIAGRLRGTLMAANMTENPPLDQPPVAGMMQPDVVPGQQPGAVWKGTAEQRKQKADEQQIQDLANSPDTPAALKGFLRVRSALPKGENIPYQLITEPNGPQGSTTDANYMLDGKPIVAIRKAGRLTYQGEDVTDRVKPFVPPTHDPQNSFQLQPEVDAAGKQTGRFLGYNTKTNSWEPVKGAGPGATKAAPGAAQAAQLSAKENDAIEKLNLVDQSIDKAKDLIGPGAGRVATLEQMIGNPDPRISDLKAKLLTIKDKVAGALTASNRQPSPAILKRFDELLGTQLTPESLKAATGALREMLKPTGSAATGGPKRVRYDIDGNIIP